MQQQGKRRWHQAVRKKSAGRDAVTREDAKLKAIVLRKMGSYTRTMTALLRNLPKATSSLRSNSETSSCVYASNTCDAVLCPEPSPTHRHHRRKPKLKHKLPLLFPQTGRKAALARNFRPKRLKTTKPPSSMTQDL